jgi:Protein of unknown function (DUF3592)
MVANPIRKIYEARFRNWPKTQATVDSCSWVSGHDNLGGDSGHYDVFFSYTAGDTAEVHHGSFCYEGCKDAVPYLPGERVPIQYNAKHPAQYNFPGADSNYEKLEAVLVMLLFALIAGFALKIF